MAGYLVKRVLQSMLVILGVVTLMFLVLRLSGDPVALLLGMEATPEQVEQVRRNMGFDRGIHVQYLSFLTSLARGDFGRSIRFNSPTLSMVLERLPASLELAFVSSVLATVVAVPLGVVAAVKRNSLLDNISMFLLFLDSPFPRSGWVSWLFYSSQSNSRSSRLLGAEA